MYAKWVNKYTITYDACGGYFNGDQNQTTHRDEINEGGYLNNYIPIMDVTLMQTVKRTADEQYRLIMECRNSGLSDRVSAYEL